MQFFAIMKEFLYKVFSALKNIAIKFGAMLKYLCKFVLYPCFCFFKRFCRKAPRFVAVAVAVIFLGLGGSAVALSSGATVAYDVMINGTKIATVKEKSVLAKAEILAAEIINNSKCNSLIVKPGLVCTFVGKGSITTAEELSDKIVNCSTDIVKAAVLSVNNVKVAAETDSKTINDALDKYIVEYKSVNGMESVEFSSAISVNEEYMPKNEAEKLCGITEYIEKSADDIPVCSYTTVVESRLMNYKTVSKKSDALLVGSTKVLKKGEEGEEEVTYKVSYSGGNISEKVEISSRVIEEPVDEVVLIGTKRVIAADKNGDASMCWPVKRVNGSYVSSYMGDERGHKGMDIVAKGGTPIYASATGKVTFASYDNSGYGNYIIIDHGNGIETLYGHCSELYVSVGDTVSEGESIAAVGSTGNSTGNHLHFEVRKNGSQVNPVAYIGYN